MTHIVQVNTCLVSKQLFKEQTFTKHAGWLELQCLL